MRIVSRRCQFSLRMMEYRQISEIEILRHTNPTEYMLRVDLRNTIQSLAPYFPPQELVRQEEVQERYQKLKAYKRRDAEGMIRSAYDEEEPFYAEARKDRKYDPDHQAALMAGEEGEQGG